MSVKVLKLCGTKLLLKLHGTKLVVNSFRPGDIYWAGSGSSLFWVMACRLFGTKPLPDPMLTYIKLDPWECTSEKFETKQNKSLNSLHAKLFRGNINMYLHFMSFLHTDMPKIIEILPRIRPGLTYFTQSISWLLMSWRPKEPGHQQPWYWPVN